MLQHRLDLEPQSLTLGGVGLAQLSIVKDRSWSRRREEQQGTLVVAGRRKRGVAAYGSCCMRLDCSNHMAQHSSGRFEEEEEVVERQDTGELVRDCFLSYRDKARFLLDDMLEEVDLF